MKVLSLLQPWATLVTMGVKKIETRSWQTAWRGELLIHASLGKKGKILSAQQPFTKHIRDFDSLPFGAIIGSVVLHEIMPVEMLPIDSNRLETFTLEEKAFGDYSNGRYAWLLQQHLNFKSTIPVRGSLGLWNFAIQ